MKKITDTTLAISADYRQFVEELKVRVTAARISAAKVVNNHAILLYWDIGCGLVEKQKTLGWGDSVVEMVSKDLQRAFPQMTGFSPRNLRSAKQFFLAYSDSAIWLQAAAKLTKGAKDPEIWLQAAAKLEAGKVPEVILRQPVAELASNKKRRQLVAKLGANDHPTTILQQPVAELEAGGIWPQAVAKLEGGDLDQFLPQLVAQIPWGHHLLVLNKLTDPVARLWYLRATASFGWSRNVLLNQIKAEAYERSVTEKKTHNFDLALPEHFAEQADEMLKSSYNLELLYELSA